MADPYTSPANLNGSSIDGLFVYLQDVTTGWFSNMLLIGIFVIFLIGYLNYNKDDFIGALAVSSFVTFVVATLFWIIGFVNGYSYGIVIGVTIVTAIVLFMDRR